MGPHQEWCHVEPLWGDAFSSGIGRPHKKLSGCGIVRTGSLPLKEKGRVVEQMSISSPPPVSCFLLDLMPTLHPKDWEQASWNSSSSAGLCLGLTEMQLYYLSALLPSHPLGMLCYLPFQYKFPTEWSRMIENYFLKKQNLNIRMRRFPLAWDWWRTTQSLPSKATVTRWLAYSV